MYNRKAVDEFVTFIQAANGIADKSALIEKDHRGKGQWAAYVRLSFRWRQGAVSSKIRYIREIR
jgi:hypothetical protein